MFRNNVISMKHISPLWILDILFGPLAYLLRNNFHLFGFQIFLSVLDLISALLFLWTYEHITQQNDTNQNIWVKPIGLWQGCRYVHDDIFYDCWSGGFRFICIVFHHYIEKYSIYKQDLCFSPCRIYFVPITQSYIICLISWIALVVHH